VLRNCGVIDPTRISTYLDRGGFEALEKARNEMTPEAVIEELKASGLRGRGGAGFPCGLKWELARKTQGNVRYIIANADEGEVGTFKDRYILEKDPFTLIEAMGIAGYTIGSKMGYIYLRAEYHFLRELLTNTITQVKRAGLLPHFEIEIREGAGAYICGEESALMDSIEGKRGEVRYRPPFPPQSGLWGKPTVINNVETLINIPQIVQNGAMWFNQLGTEHSKGTKVFSVSGDVQKPGVYELTMGSTLRELVEGLALAKETKMIQIGGATGRIVTYEMIDTPLTFETILGAGAITVFDQRRDVIDMAYRTMEFLNEESCGKCTPCREGTQVILEILSRLSRREGVENDITTLQEVSTVMSLASLCGLGQAAPNPVLDSLKYFKSDYEDRICNVKLGV
jgi:NADH:ubiquinone oxidoreductase subunit F (NADH-binding)